MEEKRQIVRDYSSIGLRLDEALKIVSLARSTYYEKRNYGIKGKRNTRQTPLNNILIEDIHVVENIKEILAEEFIDYGYRKVTNNLKRKGYKINGKKVYRLMKENKLLNEVKKTRKSFERNIIKQKPRPTKPMEILEMDIKYVYIDEEQRNAYLLTILDTFHREVYEWNLMSTMKTQDVKLLIEQFIDNHLIKGDMKIENMSISFRTDNGSQFTSKMYKSIMESFRFACTYIPPATPQLNGHIESYHSTVEKLVCTKYKFASIKHAKEIMSRFVETYNKKRDLACLLNMPPNMFISEWKRGKIDQKEKGKKLVFFFKEEGKTQVGSLENKFVNAAT